MVRPPPGLHISASARVIESERLAATSPFCRTRNGSRGCELQTLQVCAFKSDARKTGPWDGKGQADKTPKVTTELPRTLDRKAKGLPVDTRTDLDWDQVQGITRKSEGSTRLGPKPRDQESGQACKRRARRGPSPGITRSNTDVRALFGRAVLDVTPLMELSTIRRRGRSGETTTSNSPTVRR